MQAPLTRGVFRFGTQEAADDFEEHAHSLALSEKVKRLTEEASRRLLGAFHVNGSHCFRVPDTVFDEAALMDSARLAARGAGVKFEQGQATLARSDSAKNGYELLVGNRRVEASAVALCAGAGLPELLAQLGLDHPLRTYLSPLLCIACPSPLRVPLLVDRSADISVAVHRSRGNRRGRTLVIGNRSRRPVSNPSDPDSRNVLDTEKVALLKAIPAVFHKIERRWFTGGFKTEAQRQGRSSVDPWVYKSEKYPGLVAAVPGKATLSLYTAEEILSALPASVSRTLSLVSPMKDDSPVPMTLLHSDVVLMPGIDSKKQGGHE